MVDRTSQSRFNTYIFAGGGSGGHLYPALAVWEQLREDEHARAMFLCSRRAIDRRILSGSLEDDPHATFEELPAMPLSIRPKGLVRFFSGFGPSVARTREIIRTARSHGDAVLIAMGGFVAAPCAQAGRVERTPVVLVNLDAVPGRANRFIATRARTVLSAQPLADGQRLGGSVEVVGPIVRRAALASTYGPKPVESVKTLVVTGGSQGGRSVNRFVFGYASAQKRSFEGWRVLHQAGVGDEDEARSAWADLGIEAEVVGLVDDIGRWWRDADLAVCRAGAGTVAEVWANRVPCLFLPYPFHKDEHQRRNASPLVDAGGSAMTRDLVDPDKNITGRAGRLLGELMRDDAKRGSMRVALAKLGGADGAGRTAQVVRGQ